MSGKHNMIEQLHHFETYRSGVLDLIYYASSLEEFSRILKHDLKLKKLRNNARSEFQSYYDEIRMRFNLPRISVWLPVRKKISVMGKACHLEGIPKEIKIYFLKGCEYKHYNYWLPTDLRCHPTLEVFETFVHEVAHVFEVHRTGVMTHEISFVDAYAEIEEYIRSRGHGCLLDPSYRLTGVPLGSYAARTGGASTAGQGCLTLLISSLPIVVLLLTLLMH